MRYALGRLGVGLLFILMLTPSAMAQVPRLVSYQGVLADTAGNAVADATYTVTFRIYTAAVGGAAIFTEAQAVTTSQGLFSVQIGAVTAGGIPTALTFTVPYYLGITIDAGVELVPRTVLTTSPYAFTASALQVPITISAGYGSTLVTVRNTGGGAGVHGIHTPSSGTTAGVIGETGSGSADAVGVLGLATASNQGASAAAVRGTNSGTDADGYGVAGTHGGSGAGVYGYAPSGSGLSGLSATGIGVNASSTAGTAVRGASNGSYAGYFTSAAASGASLYSQTTGAAHAVDAVAIGTGRAGSFTISNALNASTAVLGTTMGTGRAASFTITNPANASPALYAESMGVWDGVQGVAAGNGASGVAGRNNHAGGYGLRGTSTDGIGVIGITANGTGGYFSSNASNTGRSAVYALQMAAGAALVADHGGIDQNQGEIALFRNNGANVARISRVGRGFFNMGTQVGGADVAEAFATEGAPSDYEPGDVLVISTRTDRTVERSSAPHSTLVAGVYATKPGVLLSDLHIDADHDSRVPLGVIGVIPTKVSAENGPIVRGDLLVTSSLPGHAMKAGPSPGVGTVLGKALEDFGGAATGVIDVLVSVK